MKKVIGVISLLASLAFCSVGLAAGIIVHNGQTVVLPCTVTGPVIVQAGGTVKSDYSCSTTTIQGSLDLKPGSHAELCNTTVTGSLIAKGLTAGSYFRNGTVNGSTLNDGSLSTTGSCQIGWMT